MPETIVSAAAGRVAIGFSQPYVAIYAASAGAVTYSRGQKLARGVSVSLDVNSADENTFYADNQAAENAGGEFADGSVTLTVDGLLMAAHRLIRGLPEPDADGWTPDGDATVVPYCGVGYITKYMSGGVIVWVPTVLCKAKFSVPGEEAETQGEGIDWQTQELNATLMRDDSTAHNWRFLGAEFATEAAAEAALKTKLGITG
jgi:phi13 family phage major tail protein